MIYNADAGEWQIIGFVEQGRGFTALGPADDPAERERSAKVKPTAGLEREKVSNTTLHEPS
jgi:hypothetical protein